MSAPAASARRAETVLAWLPTGLAAVAEGAWIRVVAGFVTDFGLGGPELPLPVFVAGVAVGAALARRLASRLGPRWPAVGLAGAVAGGLAGLAIAAGPGISAGLGAAAGAHPGSALLGLAVLRGYGLATLPLDESRQGRLLAAGVVGLSVAAALGGLVAPPYGPRFAAETGPLAALFAVAGVLALMMARLAGLGGGISRAWRRDPERMVGAGALVGLAILVAVPASAVLGPTLELLAGILVGPLLVVGMLAGWSRATARLLLAVLLIGAGLAVLVPLLAGGGGSGPIGPGPGLPPGLPEPDPQPVLVVGTWVLGVVAAIVALVLIRAWVRTPGQDDADGIDERTIERISLPRGRPRWPGYRTPAPSDAVGAYRALLADLSGRPGVRREPAETPAAHAHRLRENGRGSVSLELLAADYALVRFANRPLSAVEDRRAVRRWRRLRRDLRPVPPPPALDRKAGPAPDDDLTIHAGGADQFPSLTRAPEERQK